MKTIISIYGPTAVGKSTIVKSLIDQLGNQNCTRISIDHYIKTKPKDIDILEFLNSDPIDWDLVKRHINVPLGSTVHRPLFDQDNYVRISDNGGKELQINKLIFIDGAWPYVNADIKVQLNLDSLRRFRRLILRYFYEWGEKGKIWVKYATENWEDLPGVYEDLEADLYLDTSHAIESNTKRIMKAIKIKEM
jgi:uridine kinase